MSININKKTDYSTLFSSLNSNTGKGSNLTSTVLGGTSDISNLLNDYTSIKNGSYSKLVKAYYKKNGNTKTETSTENQSKTANKVSVSASEVQTKAYEITKALKSSDDDKLYEAVKGFADSYNSLLDNVDSLGNETITKTAQNLLDEVGANISLLSSSGISIDSETGELSVSKEGVAAGRNSLSALFGNRSSFISVVTSKASSINTQATRIANGKSVYNFDGTTLTSETTSVGTIFDSLY